MLIDLGRHIAGFVIFGLCALFSAVALVPCWYLFHFIEAQSSTMVAFLSTPFLYGVWGWSYIALTVVYKRVIMYSPTPGEWPLFSRKTIGWGTTGALQGFGNVMFLCHWRGTTMLNLYMSLMGAKIGRRVSINTVDVYDWDMITIDDDVILGGGSAVLGHLVEGNKLKMRPVHLQKGALIGVDARVMPGCSVEPRGILAIGAIMKKDSTVTENAIFGGTPAELVRLRNDRE